MAVLDTDQIDRELDSRATEVAAITATLLELDSHPGREHLRSFPPTGVTAQRWAVVQQSLGQLWEDLGRMTSILESARAVRARRGKPTDDDRAELTRWLRDRPLEVARHRIPLAQRVITSAGETVDYVGLTELAERMRAGYPVVAEFLDAVDAIDSLVANGLAAPQARLDQAGATGPPEMAELLVVSASDPLSLTTADVERRIRLIAHAVDRRSSELTELAALQANWSEALASTATQLTLLRDATQRAAATRAHAEERVVTGPLPDHTDALPALQAELAGAADAAALRLVRLRIAAAVQVAQDDEALAQGLLDRRVELKGRLTAYQAKAARLGFGEDPELLASGRIAAGLLSRRPCDLRAITRAITDFQQLIAEKQGQSR